MKHPPPFHSSSGRVSLRRRNGGEILCRVNSERHFFNNAILNSRLQRRHAISRAAAQESRHYSRDARSFRRVRERRRGHFRHAESRQRVCRIQQRRRDVDVAAEDHHLLSRLNSQKGQEHESGVRWETSRSLQKGRAQLQHMTK